MIINKIYLRICIVRREIYLLQKSAKTDFKKLHFSYANYFDKDESRSDICNSKKHGMKPISNKAFNILIAIIIAMSLTATITVWIWNETENEKLDAEYQAIINK